MYPSTAKKIEHIKDNARIAFANHVSRILLDSGPWRNWLFSRDGTSQYRYTFTAEPHHLTIIGFGHTVVLTGENDIISWARKWVDDLDYFGDHVVASGGPRMVYSPDVARDWLDEFSRMDGWSGTRHPTEAISRLQKHLTTVADDELAFLEAAHQVGILSGPPCLREWSPEIMWCREALRWFLEKTK